MNEGSASCLHGGGGAARARAVEAWQAELAAEYRRLSDHELADSIDYLERVADDLADELARPVSLALWQGRYHAARAEFDKRLARRSTRARIDTSILRAVVDWGDLAKQIKDHHDGIHLVLAGAGVLLRRVGWSGRRACDEYAGACPVCGGHDRFRVWPGPPGHYWCRQCRASGSVIDAWQYANPGGSFIDAVQALAGECGVSVPQPEAARAIRAGTAPNRNIVRLRPVAPTLARQEGAPCH